MEKYFAVLGLSSDASDDEVKKARRRLLFDLHADRLPVDLPEGASRLIHDRVLEINDAYERIMSERSRQRPLGSSAAARSSGVDDQNASSDKAGGNFSDHSDDSGNSAKPDQAPKKAKRFSGFITLVSRVAGVAIGLVILQTSRGLFRNERPASFPERANGILESGLDYCPQVISSVKNPDKEVPDFPVKILSVMLREAPAGSRYRHLVDDLVPKIVSQDESERKKALDELKVVYGKYMHSMCGGEVYLARYGFASDSASAGQESVSVVDVFSSAVCAALRNGEELSTTEKQRVVGAIYLGREIDKLPADQAASFVKRLGMAVQDEKWSERYMGSVIKKCPEVSYRFYEE